MWGWYVVVCGGGMWGYVGVVCSCGIWGYVEICEGMSYSNWVIVYVYLEQDTEQHRILLKL